MKNCDDLNEVNKVIKKYTEEEFKELLKIFPKDKLISTIKNNPKEFSNETKGFRVEKLELEKIQNIYSKKIYKENNILLAKKVRSLETNILIDTRLNIENEKIKGYLTEGKCENIDKFKELINELLKTNYKNNLKLFLKVAGYKLNKEEEEYIDNEIKNVLLSLEIEKNIQQKLDSEYNKKLKEIEKKHKVEIKEKLLEIENYKEKIVLLEKDITQKKIEISKERSSKEIVSENVEKSFKNRERKLENKINNLEESQKKLLLHNNKLLEENSKLLNKVTELGDIIEEKYVEFNDIFNDRLLKDNEKILEEKSMLENSIMKIQDKLNFKLLEINKLDQYKEEIEETVKIVENTAGNVVNNISKLLKVIDIDSKESSPNIADVITKSKIYNKDIIELDDNCNELDDIEYFIDDLSENLTISGVASKFSIDLAQYIYAILVSELNLLLVGYNSRRIANAISKIVQGSDAHCLVLPLGYDNFKEVIDMINNSNSKVILIENSIDTISESLYLTIIRENLDKHIIFSMESIEMFNILPQSIFNYFMMVDLDTIYDYEHSEELIKSICSNNIFNKSNIKNKKTYVKKLKKVDDCIKNSVIAKHKISEVLAIVDSLGSTNSFYDFIIFSLYMVCNVIDKTSELDNLVRSGKLEGNSEKILLELIKDNQYE